VLSLDNSLSKYILLVLSSLALNNPLLAAEDSSQLCPANFLANQPKPIPRETEDERVYISSDSATVDSESVTVFEGSVKAKQANRILEADIVRYDRISEDVDATGNIAFSTDEIRITGDAIHLNLEREQGTVDNAQYFTSSVNGRGIADKITLISKTEVELDQASFTTCPPEGEAWALRADTINLNNQTRQGTADNVLLEIAHMPVLYLPYIRFPIGDERMSGFLYPGFGTSNRHGTEVSLPYYWNIAPNMDATINPNYMSKRGVLLETEFRYLTENNQGVFEFTYLPDDKVFGDDRDLIAWNHQGTPAAGWSTAVDYKRVSDTEYLDDFAPSLGTASVTHLNRTGRLDYNHEYFLFSSLVQNYQNISGTEPYQRLPQITLNSRFTNQDNQLNYDINSELVYFEHKDDSKITGQRLKLVPYLSYPFQTEAGFFVPKVSVHHLQYNLEDLASPTDDDSPSVTVPVTSIDMGIFLERDTEIAGKKLLHTLEPRLFYLYAPEKSQDNFPVFDTALTTFSQSLLFSENRFSGNDRIADANQLTTALTTRFYQQDNGAELFNATLGQIIYFQDRTVTLPGGQVQTSDRSSYLGSVYFAPNPRLKINGDIQWDPETRHTEFANSRISYQADQGKVINYDYRFTRNSIRSQGISFAWRINPRWQMIGGHQYDMQNDRRLENFLGFRYDSCCWAIRLIGHEKFDRLEGTELLYDDAIYLELELKGLSSLGARKEIDTLIENGILGYSE
jgi:LPS-assembly protein